MLTKRLFATAFVGLLAFATVAQNPSPTPSTEQPASQDQVVRITTNLVQVDVSVFDKDNNLVTDLKPEDFEIRQDNRVQKITNFSFVSSDAPTPGPKIQPPADSSGATVPSTRLRPSQVKRTIAIVVDDLWLTFESTSEVRKAIQRFVDTQIQPGDLVAIIRTSGSMGVLQQFTADKVQLNAAISKIRWTPSGHGDQLSVAPIRGRYESNDEIKDLQDFRNEVLSAGVLEPLAYVIRGLKDLPGRKSVVFFSENLTITSAVGLNDRLLNAMEVVVDAANRASVVLYTQDASGLQPLNYSAVDSSRPGRNNISELGLNGGASMGGSTGEAGLARLGALAERRRIEFETHSVLDYLARRTGGSFSKWTNDLNTSIRNALRDGSAYYLIGYRPDEESFDPKTAARRFHKWEIKVKRPGLKVRYRSGFYGSAEEASSSAAPNAQAELVKALISPFSSGDIHVRLTSVFQGDPKAGATLNSLIHIDGRDLVFKEAADGWREASINVLAMLFGDNGAVVDQSARSQTIRVRKDTYDRFLKDGLVYSMTVPVKRRGAYQLRVAVQDATTSRMGSAGQFVEAPDLTRDRLSLSSVVVSAADAGASTAAASTANASEDQYQQQITSAARRFTDGSMMDYGYVIYNAQLDKANKQPQLQTQIRLLREGQEIYAGKATPFDVTGQRDLKQLIAGGRLQIGSAMQPGQYILQVIVTDQLAKEKFRTTSQWIDFEVVK